MKKKKQENINNKEVVYIQDWWKEKIPFNIRYGISLFFLFLLIYSPILLVYFILERKDNASLFLLISVPLIFFVYNLIRPSKWEIVQDRISNFIKNIDKPFERKYQTNALSIALKEYCRIRLYGVRKKAGNWLKDYLDYVIFPLVIIKNPNLVEEIKKGLLDIRNSESIIEIYGALSKLDKNLRKYSEFQSLIDIYKPINQEKILLNNPKEISYFIREDKPNKIKNIFGYLVGEGILRVFIISIIILLLALALYLLGYGEIISKIMGLF